jgi:hypothetical membrane protein
LPSSPKGSNLLIVPNNKLIRAGVLIIAASALLWLGAVALSALKDMFIYFGVAGIVVMLIGIFTEIKRGKDGKSSTKSDSVS